MSETFQTSTVIISPIRHPSPLFSDRRHLRRWGFFACSFLCLLLLMRHSDIAMVYMVQGLSLCTKTVIPSLFPFMVLSELLVASGGGEVLGKIFETPCKKLFGVSGASACAIIMGAICGFPIGTKTAVSLCQRGQISTNELSRLICFCNIPSAAFLINAVGGSLFGSRRFGLILYGICLVSAILTALLLRIRSPLSCDKSAERSVTSQIGFSVFIHSVTSASTAMIHVCAYVVFFSALIGTLGQLLNEFGVGHTVIASLFGFFELSGGVMQAATLSNRRVAQWLVALMCGWSGISVHLQILSLCEHLPNGNTVKAAPYFLSKLFQGILCALLCGIALYFIPQSWLTPAQYIDTWASWHHVSPQISTFINALFGFGGVISLLHSIAQKKHGGH